MLPAIFSAFLGPHSTEPVFTLDVKITLCHRFSPAVQPWGETFSLRPMASFIGLLSLISCLVSIIEATKRNLPHRIAADIPPGKRLKLTASSLELLPAELWCNVFEHVLNTKERSPTGSILIFSCISRKFNQITRSDYFSTCLRNHPATEVMWLMKNPSVSKICNFDLLLRLKRSLSTTQTIKLIYNALDIEVLKILSDHDKPKYAPPVNFIPPGSQNIILNLASDITDIKWNDLPIIPIIKGILLQSHRGALSDTAFFLLGKIFREWRNLGVNRVIKTFISLISDIRCSGSKSETISINLLLLPLIFAALADEHDFFNILPDHFLELQLDLHQHLKYSHSTILSIIAYRKDPSTPISDDVLKYFQRYEDFAPFGYMGFDRKMLAARFQRTFLDPRFWDYTLAIDIRQCMSKYPQFYSSTIYEAQ